MRSRCLRLTTDTINIYETSVSGCRNSVCTDRDTGEGYEGNQGGKGVRMEGSDWSFEPVKGGVGGNVGLWAGPSSMTLLVFGWQEGEDARVFLYDCRK